MSSDSETAAAPSTIEALAAVRPDLDSRAKTHDLVVDFYREIAFDDLLGPVFAEVPEVDRATHIRKLIEWTVPTRCPEQLRADLVADAGIPYRLGCGVRRR